MRRNPAVVAAAPCCCHSTTPSCSTCRCPFPAAAALVTATVSHRSHATSPHDARERHSWLWRKETGDRDAKASATADRHPGAPAAIPPVQRAGTASDCSGQAAQGWLRSEWEAARALLTCSLAAICQPESMYTPLRTTLRYALNFGGAEKIPFCNYLKLILTLVTA